MALAAGLGLAACAEVAPPPGGPVDETPPTVVYVMPGSLVTRVDPRQPITIEFSEKVDRRAAARALVTIPRVDLERPRFDDLTVTWRPRKTWPADTVVVWTVNTSLTDKRRVALEAPIEGAFTTGQDFPPGMIVGRASRRVSPAAADTTRRRKDAEPKEIDWTKLRAELEIPPPEGTRRSTLWRTAAGDDQGRFRLTWLDLPSGPYDLRVYLDRNENRRRDEREPVAEVDSLFLGAADSI